MAAPSKQRYDANTFLLAGGGFDVEYFIRLWCYPRQPLAVVSYVYDRDEDFVTIEFADGMTQLYQTSTGLLEETYNASDNQADLDAYSTLFDNAEEWVRLDGFDSDVYDVVSYRNSGIVQVRLDNGVVATFTSCGGSPTNVETSHQHLGYGSAYANPYVRNENYDKPPAIRKSAELAKRDHFAHLKSPKKGEPKMTMKKTKDAVKDSLTTGAKLATASSANKQLIKLVRKWMGGSYPEFLKSGPGKMMEPMLIPALVHFMAENVTQLPEREKVAMVAELAMTSASKDQLEPLILSMMPLFEEAAKIKA